MDKFVGFTTKRTEQSRALRVTQGAPPWPSPHPSFGDRGAFSRHHRLATSVFTSIVLVSYPKRNVTSFRQKHRLTTARGIWGVKLCRRFTKESQSSAWRSPECRSHVPSPRSSTPARLKQALCHLKPVARGAGRPVTPRPSGGGPAASAFPVSPSCLPTCSHFSR